MVNAQSEVVESAVSVAPTRTLLDARFVEQSHFYHTRQTFEEVSEDPVWFETCDATENDVINQITNSVLVKVRGDT
jgi:hypothetical protein